ncbi:hypothetical protein HPB52_009202 [Rhipicephalus sanguineus]|uniref:CCHC-type domain-containing protein n=1 Tax=Rhipicephalus sanguineus TaxID=34632 RepID=A0A9D4PI27_RHISA|nr:hypothetical protein HPB52_009202 [Rhipicephalus sanguineus]
MEIPAYVPSAEAKQLAAADAAAAMGAPSARPPRNRSHTCHKRTTSHGHITPLPAHSVTPQDAKTAFQKWSDSWEARLSRSTPPAEQSPPATMVTMAPLESCPTTPTDPATAESFPPLPAPSAEEDMDMSLSRKRPRSEDSSDEEGDGPRKLIMANLSSEEYQTDDSTTSLQSATTESSEASLPTSEDDSTGPTNPPSEDSATNHASEPATHTPAAAPASAEATATSEVPEEEMDDGNTSPPTCCCHLFFQGNTTATRSRAQPQRAPPPAPPLVPVASSPSSWQPEDQEGFQPALSKAARRRARDMTAATLPVDPAVVGTVLYRPSTAGGSFKGSPRLTLAQALSSHAGVSAIRINHKRNIVAADATTKECLEQLLAIRELQGIPVSAREPSDRRTSTGFLHGIDGEPSDASLLPGIVSSVPVMSATREGSTVTLRFSGPVPPEYVSLFRVQFRVRPARPRPLQCRQCGRFGHVKETCDWPQSCINCGQAHRGDEGCQRRRCVNCGGPHSADTPACPRWQQERRVATIMASSTAPLSRKGVRAAVREELQQDQVPRNTGRSYASVLQGSSMPAALEPRAPAARTSRPPRPTVGSNIQGPAAPPLAPPAGTVATPPPAEAPAAISSQAGTPSGPAATSQPTGDSGGPAATTRPPPQVTPGPAATTEVQQAISSLAEILLQAMRIACATLPADHPLRPICLQAGSNPRCRQYQTTDWKAFRSLMDQANEGTDFLQQVAENAKAAAIHSTVPDGKPAPDLRLLRLRAARRRLERKARRALLPELWTAFRRLDAVCRRHARRRRRQSWRSVCSTISRNPDGARAWRLLRALLASPRGLRQALSVAVLLCVSITVLVERLANRFADRPPVPPALYLPATTTRPSPTWHHPAWMAEQIRRLCSEPIQFHELEAALEHTRRRGAPGADGITGQMLRNLARQQRERLLEQYNSIWSTGVLPDVWLTAVVTEALLVHPLASARHRAGQLHIAGTAIPWSREVTYLGLTIDHRLTWIPAAKVISAKVRRVQGAVARLHQRGQGCTVQWALRLNQAAATSILLYALPLVLLSPVRLRQLEMLHRRAVRSILGLPKTSPIAATLAEAGEWPLSLLMMQRALGHVDRLHRAPDGEALLTRLRNMPRSRMGALCQLCSEVITDRPVPVPAPPPHQPSPEVHLTLVWTAARLHAKGRISSPSCSRCGDVETLDHLLCSCPALAQERAAVTAAYRHYGLPSSTTHQLLHPARPHVPAFLSLLEFVNSNGLLYHR